MFSSVWSVVTQCPVLPLLLLKLSVMLLFILVLVKSRWLLGMVFTLFLLFFSRKADNRLVTCFWCSIYFKWLRYQNLWSPVLLCSHKRQAIKLEREQSLFLQLQQVKRLPLWSNTKELDKVPQSGQRYILVISINWWKVLTNVKIITIKIGYSLYNLLYGQQYHQNKRIMY